jgi:hypothetical protein
LLARHAGRVPILGGAVSRIVGSDPNPYTGSPTQAPNIPAPDYAADQPPVREPTDLIPGYHDRPFKNAAPPTYFGGIDITAAREAIELHDSGASFLLSSILAIASTRFAPVQAALWVRVAPLISLPRQVVGGSRGLARIVREEVESQLCPRTGLLPSACFPSTLWGAIAIDLALMGFAVLQHVYGPPDARGVRRVYTRRWPTWAVYYQAWRKTYIALTDRGPIDIVNDGKFTLIGKTDIPHLQGAIRALALPVLDGVQVMQARAEWIDVFSQAKGVGIMPQGVAPRSPEGLAFLDAIRTLRGPGGIGALPFGSEFKFHGLSAEASTCFKDALEVDDTYIAAILTGTDLSAGTGGVYKAPVFWGILRSTVGDDLSATVRGINAGHVYPYCRFNYAAAIDEGDWDTVAEGEGGTEVQQRRSIDVDKYPALSIPLPDPERAQRAQDYADACKAHTEIVNERRAAGYVVTQEDSDKIAESLGLDDRPVLADKTDAPTARLDLAPTDLAKVVRVDEARKSRDLPPIGDERGDLTIAELDAMSKAKATENASANEPDAQPAETGSDAGTSAPRDDSAAEEPQKDEAA